MSENATPVTPERKTFPSGSYFGFLDVETTGLTQGNFLLEVGLLVARYHERWEWQLLEVHHHVLAPPIGHTDVWEFHHKNSLWSECQMGHSKVVLVGLAAQLKARGIVGIIPVGRNVHFDTNVLKADAPDLASCFTYRHLDLTSLEMGGKLGHGPVLHKVGAADSTHRALHDAMMEYQRVLVSDWVPESKHHWRGE